MSTYIFAIGGSGARVLRALTMLLASGCKGTSAQNEIVANVIDYDTQNGDTTRTLELMETYHKLHGAAYTHKDADTEQFFCNPLLMLRDKCDAAKQAQLDKNARFNMHLAQTVTNTTFAKHIGYNSLGVGSNNMETKLLLQSLYNTSDEKIPGTNEDNPDAELNMNLHKGFKGCPNLGCIVTKYLEDSAELRLAVDSLIGPNDKIIIIGSLFGGTGASGIPMLLDLFTRNPRTQNVRKAVIALLPYFQLAPPDNNNKSAIDSNTFIAKVKAALTAYNGTINNQANCFYYVGDQPQNAFANIDGDAGQRNDAHYVELASAMCVLDFIDQNGNGGFEVVLKQRPDNGLDKDSFCKQESYDPFIYPMARFKLFSTFCKNYFPPSHPKNNNDLWWHGIAERGCRAIGDANCNNYRNELLTFIGYFDTWIAELSNHNSHRPLTLFNNTQDYKDVWAFKKLYIEGGLFGIGKWELKDGDFTLPLTNQYNNDNPAGAGAVVNRPEYLFWKGSRHTMQEIDKILLNKGMI